MRISTARRIYSCRDSESGSLRNLVPLPNKRLAGSRSSRIFRMLTSRIVGCKPEQTRQTRMRKGGAPKKEWRKRRREESRRSGGFHCSTTTSKQCRLLSRDSINCYRR